MSPLSHSAALPLLILGLSSAAAAQSAPVSRSLDDPTALATFEALIRYDIETAGIAAKKAANSDVRDVASTFVQGHKGLLKQAQDLAKSLNMTPTPPKNAPLGRAHYDALRELKATTGEKFDSVFIANEVAYHAGAIDILRDSLAPAIKNPQLKAAVNAAVPAFQAHLAASQKLATEYHVQTSMLPTPHGLRGRSRSTADAGRRPLDQYGTRERLGTVMSPVLASRPGMAGGAW
jgi:putative membrane protein